MTVNYSVIAFNYRFLAIAFWNFVIHFYFIKSLNFCYPLQHFLGTLRTLFPALFHHPEDEFLRGRADGIREAKSISPIGGYLIAQRGQKVGEQPIERGTHGIKVCPRPHVIHILVHLLQGRIALGIGHGRRGGQRTLLLL